MSLYLHRDLDVSTGLTRRRDFLRTVSAGAVAMGTLGFRDLMTIQAAQLRKQGMSLILLWMQGGPSQLETFDPKPGTETGGPTRAINTAVPGIRIAEGWTATAKAMGEIALIRSMTNKEGQHQRATYQLHTGYLPTGTVKHPNLGCSIAKEIAPADTDLPAVVSVGTTEGAGFLGVDYEPFVVQDPGTMPRNVTPTVQTPRFSRRLELTGKLDAEFAATGASDTVRDHQQLYGKTSRLVLSPEVRSFDISGEPQSVKSLYGDSQFGKGCLLARRLVESGVTFVTFNCVPWDHHGTPPQLETEVGARMLIPPLDRALGALIDDLQQRGLYEKTLVVIMGEFGRTPRMNANRGRDHWGQTFSVVMGNAKMRMGQVIGRSSPRGEYVVDRPISPQDVAATVYHHLGIDSRNVIFRDTLNRPVPLIESGQPIRELL